MITEDKVRTQYNRYPYPSFSWLAKVTAQNVCHASFEVGASLVHHKFESHENKKIALLGCGTFEPYVQGTLHSQTKVDAVDISPKSLTLAKRRCLIRRVKNINFIESDITSFCRNNPETYDFISCYGVLHHLPNPMEGFKALSHALKPEGFARIMVYSQTQRRRPKLIRQALKSLGINSESFLATVKIKSLLRCLPLSHPLKLSQFSNTELSTRSGVIDSLLHACENDFNIKSLTQTLKEADLTIQAWDFSENLLRLLSDAPGSTLEEQIHFLESFDQWPGPFVFWASKTPVKKTDELLYRTNPHLKKALPKKLPSKEIETLNIAMDKAIPFEEGFLSLIRKRYLLQVSS
jgi:2-polyprenyl-3-methyl-5-hydroxy-6-metoxy-1,4-benzoquinol methylase